MDSEFVDPRPSWDQYFMDMAEHVSTRATCDRKHVGAVLVKSHRFVASGYNGSIPGAPHCDDPEEFWICAKCGKKFTEKPGTLHDLSCAGYDMLHRHGGHDMDEGHCVRTIHAEVNAIADAAKRGVSTDGCTLYCNTMPCWHCFKTVVSAGIVEIVYRDAYRPEKHKRVYEAAQQIPGFIMRQFDLEE